MDRISTLQEFLAANPADSFVQHALALEYVKTGEDKKARQLFDELLSRDPDYVGSYYHLGKLLERTDQSGEAIRVYERGMEIARKLEDQHSYAELKAALEELIY